MADFNRLLVAAQASIGFMCPLGAPGTYQRTRQDPCGVYHPEVRICAAEHWANGLTYLALEAHIGPYGDQEVLRQQKRRFGPGMFEASVEFARAAFQASLAANLEEREYVLAHEGKG